MRKSIFFYWILLNHKKLNPSHLPQISAGASSPKLSDTTEYPTFMRTVSSDTAVVDGIVTMMKQYDWSHVACITQQEFLFTAVSLGQSCLYILL